MLATEWNEFREPDFPRIKTLMRRPAIFDGRNIYNPQHAARRWASTTRGSAAGEGAGHRRRGLHRQPRRPRAAGRGPRGDRARRPLAGPSRRGARRTCRWSRATSATRDALERRAGGRRRGACTSRACSAWRESVADPAPVLPRPTWPRAWRCSRRCARPACGASSSARPAPPTACPVRVPDRRGPSRRTRSTPTAPPSAPSSARCADHARAGRLRAIALRYFNAAGCHPDGSLGEDHDPRST